LPQEEKKKMKSVLSFIGATAVVLLVLAGCQTAKPIVPEENLIQTESAGFSPMADRGPNTIEFNLIFGNRDLVSTWKVEIVGVNGAVKTFSGDSSTSPAASLTWDGMNDWNVPSPEGTYTANLAVDYAGKIPAASASSNSFVLDRTEPIGTLSADPTGFMPTSRGVVGPVTITVGASSPLARIQSWGVDIFDPDGKLFQSFTGQGADGKMSWDGKGLAGDWVQPSRMYAALATIRDEYGLAGTARLAINVADMPAAPAVSQQKVQTGQNMVQSSLLGFSPSSETGPRSIGIVLTFGNPGAVRFWKLTIDN
jgi:hypothetical protein